MRTLLASRLATIVTALLATLVLVACDGEPGEGGTDAGTELLVIHVDAAAAPGGDGSLARPLRTLDEALALPDPPRTPEGLRNVRVAAGTYPAPASAWDSAFVEGAGAETVVDVVGTQSFEALTMSRLALHGSASFEGTSLSLRDVALEADVLIDAGSLDGTTLRLAGSEVTLFVEDATLQTVSADNAVLAIEAGDVRVDDALFADGAGPVLRVGDADVTLVDVRIEDPGFVDGEPFERGDVPDIGTGLLVEGGTVDLQRVSVVRALERGINVRGGSVVGDDVTIAGGGVAALGVQAWDVGGEPVRSDVVIEALDIDGGAVLVAAIGSDVVLRDAFLRNGGAAGVLASGGANFELYDSTVLDCDNGHISWLGEGTSGVLAGTTVRGAAVESCVAVSSTDAPVVIRDSTISECAGSGVAVLGVSDVTIEANEFTAIEASPLFPDVNEAISVVQSEVRVLGNVVHDTAGAGVALLDASGVIIDNELRDLGDAAVRLVNAGPGDTRVDGNRILRATGAGVLVLETSASLSENRIEATAFSEEFGSALGVGVAGDASATLSSNELIGAEQDGLFVDASASVASADNRYEDNGGWAIACAPGASVTSEGDTFISNASGEVAPACGL